MLNPKYQLNDFVRFTGLKKNERRFKYQFIEDFKQQQLEATAKIVAISYRTDFNIFEYEISYPFANKDKKHFVREFDLLKRKNQDYYKDCIR